MAQQTEFHTFGEMVEVFALNDPTALVLGWWRRLERAIDYYFVAYHAQRRPKPARYRAVFAADPRVGSAAVDRIDKLRSMRNHVAHDRAGSFSASEARVFAQEALDLIWILGCAVPYELAISSGAAGVA